jgi:hypothetical protein
MGSGIGFLAMSWCIEQRGPVFTTAFTPLIQLIAGAINIVALHEQLHLGRYNTSWINYSLLICSKKLTINMMCML